MICTRYSKRTLCSAFDFAFDLANSAGLKSKMPEIELKLAMSLEEEGRFKEAEEAFLRAGHAKEAVVMYINVRDWPNAARIAEAHDAELMQEIYIAQAKAAWEQNDLSQAESFLVRAQRPDASIKLYKVSPSPRVVFVL